MGLEHPWLHEGVSESHLAEKRVDKDGKAYTYAEFFDHYWRENIYTRSELDEYWESLLVEQSDGLLLVDVYTIFFRAALTGQIMGRLHVAAADPSGWSYASALRSADLNPFQYWIVKGTERLDPNHVLAEKLPLRFKREDFDEQGELHLDLVRADEQTTEMWTTALRQTTTRITSWADEDVDYGAASDDDDRGARSRSRPR